MLKESKDVVGAEEFTTFEQVKGEKTADYFRGNQFSIDAFESKYALVDNPNETYVQAIKRVCDHIASVEKTEELKEYWSKRWFHEIYNDWWHPAGSIMQGAGSGRKISLCNCFSRDTKFITEYGLKSFNDFRNGDTTSVMNNYGAFIKGTIKEFGLQRLWKLTLQRNYEKKEIFCTNDHIWRVISKNNIIVEKETRDLQENDLIPHIKRKWMPSVNGSRYYCPIGWMHGFVFGDGDYDKVTDTCNAYFCGDSREMMNLFSGFSWVKSEGEIKSTVKYLPSWMKKIPCIDGVNEEYLLGFIIGYFAADGTVDKDGRSELSSANLEHLLFIKEAGEILGLYTSDVRLIRDKSPFDGNINHKLYGLYFHKDGLFDSFFTKTSHKNNWDYYKNNIQRGKSKTQWRVISLEETDRVESVWCVIVPDSENFTLQGGVNTHNCTTITLGTGREHEEWDSLEAIIKNSGYTVAKAAAYRQGLGIDFSRLRPRGTSVLNSAKESTGSVHWMSYMDVIGNFVGQKGRIPAMLFSLSCSHPDVEEFIAVKANTGNIQNANISVQCTDAFYEAVKNNENWDLIFEVPEVKEGQKVYIDVHSTTKDCLQDEKGYYYIAKKSKNKEVMKKTVKARDLMNLIAKNMHGHAEPGIQNIDIARKYSNSDYVYDPDDEYDPRIVSTNACSEQYLSRESLCVLSSMNCGNLSVNPEEYEKELAIIAPSINRFLDNVNECELQYHTYATPHQRLAIDKLRRTGAGFTNVAGWLFEANVPYGTEKSAELMEKLTERYTYHLYKSSIDLGKEKGSFGMFNQEKLEKSPFIKRLKKLGLEFKTLRNVTVTSIAPTGTLSLMFRDLVMSYGIEPAFGLCYWKRTRMKGAYSYYFNVPSIVRKVFKNAGFEIPIDSDTIEDDWQGSKGKPILAFINSHKEEVGVDFKSATDITCVEKLELMSKVMKWVDSSISVTYMLPEDSEWKDVYNFIMLAHEKEVKSIAAFPDRKMYGIITFIPFKDLAIKLKDEGVFIHHQNFSDDELKELSMSRENVVLNTTVAPKRQEELDADIFSVTVNKEKFIIVVGLQNGCPYEIFGGRMNGLKIELGSKHMPGKISKVKRGVYALEFEETIIKDFSKQFTPVEKILFRSLSLMMRHGIPIVYIVEQLNKASDDMFSVSAACSRVLKKYIKEGQKVTGRSCPNCQSQDLFYNNGCVVCSNCDYSACG